MYPIKTSFVINSGTYSLSILFAYKLIFLASDSEFNCFKYEIVAMFRHLGSDIFVYFLSLCVFCGSESSFLYQITSQHRQKT